MRFLAKRKKNNFLPEPILAHSLVSPGARMVMEEKNHLWLPRLATPLLGTSIQNCSYWLLCVSVKRESKGSLLAETGRMKNSVDMCKGL